MIKELNERLIDFNVVKRLDIEIDPFTLSYNLTMILAKSQELFAKEIQVEFDDISQLNLSNFGGGLMQFLHLKITKINDGLERQKYEINELENDAIEFRCFSVAMLALD